MRYTSRTEMRIVRFWLILLAVATLLSLSAAAYDRSRIATADQCTLFAATNGSDSNSGSESDPFASVQKLVNSLEPNETGCLKKGTYTESDDTVDITAGGTETKPITLTTAPDEGEPARINAELYTND